MYYIIVYTNPGENQIKFEWDENKNALNKEKHEISFDSAKDVFNDPQALSWIDNRFDYNEEHWLTMGKIYDSQIIIVAHLYIRDKNEQEIIRIISARKATKKEKLYYFNQQK